MRDRTTRIQRLGSVLVEVDVPHASDFALDVYYPDASGSWPVAVVFHGGEESKTSMQGFASAAAEQGVVVFVPEYSSTPAQVSEVLHAGANDAVCAMRFARTHAPDFDGSGDRVVTAGVSYGANVAALMTVAPDEFDGDCLVGSDVSAATRGLLGLDGMYDFATLPAVLGFHDYYTDEQMQRASALTYVAPAEPGDGVVVELFTGMSSAAQDQAAAFGESLTAAGYEVRFVPQPDLPHNAFNPAPGSVEALTAMAFG